MTADTARKWRRIAGFSMLGTYLVAIAHIALNALALARNPATSFPWYAAIFYTGLYYVLPIVLLLALYVYCSVRSE